MRAAFKVLMFSAALLCAVPAAAIRDNGTAVITDGASNCPTTANKGVLLSRCMNVAVSNCPAGTLNGQSAAVADSTARIKVSDPTGTSTGTIVFITGTDNSGDWEGSATVALYMLPALARGQRLVQITWPTEPAWGAGTAGWIANHCRSATAWKAIHDDATLTTAGTPFIVLGHSGGSSQVAYTLAHYNGPSYIDLAIMSSGPPHSKLQYGVQGSANLAWVTECNANKVTATNPSCSYGAMDTFMDRAYGGDGSGGGTYTAFQPKSCFGGIDNACGGRDDVLKGDAVLNYPQTEVHFLYGDQDFTSASPLGGVYARAMKSAKTEHTITQTPGGGGHNAVCDDAGSVIDGLFAGATFRH
jgi:pimeloyl-ACP methyl ester carboxylesterase